MLSPTCHCIQQPLMPDDRIGTRKLFKLAIEPGLGIWQCLGVVMYAQNQLANRLIRAPSLRLNEFLDSFSAARFSGIMLLEQRGKRLLRQQSGFFFREHGKLRVQLELVKMLAHQLEAEAVQGADVGGLEQGEFFLPAWILRI